MSLARQVDVLLARYGELSVGDARREALARRIAQLNRQRAADMAGETPAPKRGGRIMRKPNEGTLQIDSQRTLIFTGGQWVDKKDLPRPQPYFHTDRERLVRLTGGTTQLSETTGPEPRTWRHFFWKAVEQLSGGFLIMALILSLVATRG